MREKRARKGGQGEGGRREGRRERVRGWESKGGEVIIRGKIKREGAKGP